MDKGLWSKTYLTVLLCHLPGTWSLKASIFSCANSHIPQRGGWECTEISKWKRNYRMPVLLNPKFVCSTLERPIFKKHILTGKEFELYSGGWQPGEKADSCQNPTLRLPPGSGFWKGFGVVNKGSTVVCNISCLWTDSMGLASDTILVLGGLWEGVQFLFPDVQDSVFSLKEGKIYRCTKGG